MAGRRLLALGAAGLALVGAAPARAGNDRAAARQFGYAAYRARLTILGEKAEIRRRTRALKAPACLKAIREAPGREQPRAFTVLLFGELVTPVMPALKTFVADLEAV